MRLKPDRNFDEAAFIEAVERNRLEMQKAFRRAQRLFIERELARNGHNKIKGRQPPDDSQALSQ